MIPCFAECKRVYTDDIRSPDRQVLLHTGKTGDFRLNYDRSATQARAPFA